MPLPVSRLRSSRKSWARLSESRRRCGPGSRSYRSCPRARPTDCICVTPAFRRTAFPGSSKTRTTLGLTGVTLKTLDLEVTGDTAYEVGEADLKLSSGQAKVKYVVVWLKGGDGQWRLHRDIWNNMPVG